MLKTSPSGIDLIARFEGFIATPYICPAGYKTIGYGHLIQHSEKYTVLTEAEAKQLLQNDVTHAENAVNRLISVSLIQNQFDAIVSFTFNLGSGALQSSTLRRKLNRGEYHSAANEFLRWVYTYNPVKKKLSGLVNRRIAEKNLFECHF